MRFQLAIGKTANDLACPNGQGFAGKGTKGSLSKPIRYDALTFELLFENGDFARTPSTPWMLREIAESPNVAK